MAKKQYSNMNKKTYIETMTQVIVLQQQHHLSAGSDPAVSGVINTDNLDWTNSGISDDDR